MGPIFEKEFHPVGSDILLAAEQPHPNSSLVGRNVLVVRKKMELGVGNEEKNYTCRKVYTVSRLSGKGI